jgi:hypothetical protein
MRAFLTRKGSLGASPDAIIFNNEAQQQEGGVSHIEHINKFASTNNHISGVSHSFCAEEHLGTLALSDYVGTSQDAITNSTQQTMEGGGSSYTK